jgi:carbamoyltransferase
MTVLGINGGFRQGYQDVSACIVQNGKLIAAVEEERLSRVKFSAGRLPYLSILEVLKLTGLCIEDIDVVAFHGSTWGQEIDAKLQDYFRYHLGHSPKITRFHHHDCHAASTFYASGYKEALVISMDNSGDGVSVQIAVGRNGILEVINRFDRPNSLGFFYSLISQFCGYIKDSDEYKLMGLASYGDRNKFDLSWLIDFKDGALSIDSTYIQTVAAGAPSLHRDEMNFNTLFEKKLGLSKRLPTSSIDNIYKDLAASAQKHLENVVLKMITYYTHKTGIKKICMAGGVALNCVMNQRIMNDGDVEVLYVQPASSDAGISVGAAWLASVSAGIAPVPSNNIYLGSSFSNSEIKTVLDNCRIRYKQLDNVSRTAAEFIADNKVIGWFQGAMEFGPRALGNRSILASPLNERMKELVNSKIKYREGYRPFCPSVLEADITLYFEGKQHSSPHMTVTYKVKEEMRNTIPAVSHVDGTARIQTVNIQQNRLYHHLLSELKKITGHGVVLNTSFNLSHEPIVCNPYSALATFYASGMDALFIGDFMIEK